MHKDDLKRVLMHLDIESAVWNTVLYDLQIYLNRDMYTQLDNSIGFPLRQVLSATLCVRVDSHVHRDTDEVQLKLTNLSFDLLNMQEPLEDIWIPFMIHITELVDSVYFRLSQYREYLYEAIGEDLTMQLGNKLSTETEHL